MEFLEPRKLIEANLQAELYRQLANRGISCYLEYSIKQKYFYKMTKLRADCVVLDKKRIDILAVIEVKSYRNPETVPSGINKQRKKYKWYYEENGVPFFYIYNMKTILKFIQWLNEMYPNYHK